MNLRTSQRKEARDLERTGTLRTITAVIRVALRWVLMQCLFLLSRRVRMDGLEIVDVAGEESERTLQSLCQALQLLKATDARRYQRLKRDLRRIVLFKAGGPEYASEVGACILASRYAREADTGSLASTIVHEATHARLHRRGIGYGLSLRARVEETCVNEQIDFAERLGNPGLLSHLRTKLGRQWWTTDQLHARRLRALYAMAVPRWFIACYERLTGTGRRGPPPAATG